MRAVLCAGLLAFVHVPLRAAPPLVPLAPVRVDHCERSGLLRPVCPRMVPRVGAAYLSNLSVELTGRHVLDVFDLERGGGAPGKPERNRPPRMAHVVAVAGDVERLAPHGRTTPLGRVRWGGRSGTLYRMPPFPHGGMLGDHLVLSWREDGRRYALSLHAWKPLRESIATLERMAASLPARAAARRLRRLSPVRRLALPRGPATARTTIPAPPPQQHAFDVLAVAPARADVSVEIATPGGHRLRVLESTRTECRARPPLRTCFLHFPRLEAVRGGRWTIVVTKRSAPPARIRVDVSFRRSERGTGRGSP